MVSADEFTKEADMNKRRSLSNDDFEKLKKEIDERIKLCTPLAGNKCHCGDGEVVKKVPGLFRGQFRYSLPECNTCGRIYVYATNARTVGEKEFCEILSQPFNI